MRVLDFRAEGNRKRSIVVRRGWSLDLVPRGQPPAVPNLGNLYLSASTIAENSAAGTVVGAIFGARPASTLTLVDSAGGRFAIAGANIVAAATATNFENATSHQITIRETLPGSANSPRETVISITVTNEFEQPNLSAIILSAAVLSEGSAAGTVVGALLGKTSGSALALVDDAGGRLAISEGNLVAGATSTDFETATSHSVTVRETLADSANSPRETVLSITIGNVFEQPSLAALTLSSSTATVGTSTSISIIGATAGSTLAGAVPDGMTLNSALRTITGTPAVAGTYDFTLTETLADSANSPRVSNVSVTVTVSGGWAIGLDRTPPYVPGWTRPATFAAGVASGAIPSDAIDFATGNAGGAFADLYAWIDACNAANKPGALGQDITITTAEASLGRRYLYRGIYGYGAANPKIAWKGRTTGSGSQKALFHAYLEDITIRGVEFVDWGCVLAVGQKTLPLIEPASFTASFSGTAMTVSSGSVSTGMSIYVPGSVPYGTTVVSGTAPNWVISANVGTVASTTVNVVDPQPYHTSTQPLTRIADPVIGSASGLHCPRLGKIVTSGAFNITQIAIKRQIEGTTAMGQASGGANNNYYFSDTAWNAVLETVTLFTEASCTTNAQIVSAINVNTTAGLAHGYAAVLSLSGDVLITANTVSTKSFVDMVITQTGTAATFDVKTPAVTITHCTFTDCNMTYAALLDVSELGAVEFHKNSLPGTWSAIYAQVTRWGHLRAANNEWYDCLLSRSRTQRGRSVATGAGMPTGSSLSEFNTFLYAGTDSPLMMRYMTAGTTCLIENNYAHDIESYNSTNTVNAAVFADIRNCWQRTSNGKVNRIAYNRIVSVKGVRGAEDANALYAKPRGLDVVANYIEDVGAAYYATGTQDGSEFSNGFKNPGPWNQEYTSTWGTNEVGEPFRFLGNELVNMPPGIPPFKIDEVYTSGTIIEDNIIRNWRNYKNGVEQTSGSVAGGFRITDGHRFVSFKRNRFINCDPGPTDPSLLVNFHNLKEANNTTFTSSDFQIDNNSIHNDGSAHADGSYPVYGADTTLIRLNFGSNSPATGFAAGIATGFNRILTALGAASGFRMRGLHTNRSETSVGTNLVSQVAQVNYLSSYGADH